MDALTILKREHTRIEQLFAELNALPQRACIGRRALVAEIDDTVRRHIATEEAFVYRSLAMAPGLREDRVSVLHCEEEHALILRVLDQLSATDCRDVMYIPRVLVLRDLLLHHMHDEEAVIFEMAGCAR